MKKTPFFLLAALMMILPGCSAEQDASVQNCAVSQKMAYHSDTSPEDCYLCGGGIENLVPEYWGQNNIALISLNTFEIKPIIINRYDNFGHLIEGVAGCASFTGSGSHNGGFSAILFSDYDNGLATGIVDFFSDEALDVDQAAGFLCSDCLNEILPKNLSQCFGVGAIHLNTKEICLLKEPLDGFDMGDFHIGCDMCDMKKQEDDGSRQMSLSISYGSIE